jgi:hypothetical protein
MEEMPATVLHAVVELLCTSSSWAEPIAEKKDSSSSQQNNDSSNKKSSAQQSHSSSSTHSSGNNMSFFNPQISDFEIRDLAIEVLLAFCMISISLQLRIGEVPRAVELLYRISTAPLFSSGGSSSRTEGNQKAAQILTLLLTQPALSKQFYSLRTDLYLSACAEEQSAELLCNKAQPVYNYYNAVTPIILTDSAT